MMLVSVLAEHAALRLTERTQIHASASRLWNAQLAERFMLKHDLWHETLEHGFAYMLCIGCVERRLGRRLDWRDFLPNAPINWAPRFRRSLRLRARLRGAPS